MKPVLAILLFAVLLAGCAAPAAAPTPSPTRTPAAVEQPELGRYFQGYTGAFVLVDRASGRTTRYNLAGCAEGLLPASTFKILNTLISLETGVAPDENFQLRWNGQKYPVETWNRDHTLQSAFQNSVVWYYQELARRVGRERMQQFVDRVGYGNRDLSGNLDSFWLDGGLRISADEQVAFLQRLYKNDLPFSERSMQIVRKLLVQEQTDTYTLSGKTGSTQRSGTRFGWFVGYVETRENVYFFAANIQGTAEDVQAAKAREIALKVLQHMRVLP